MRNKKRRAQPRLSVDDFNKDGKISFGELIRRIVKQRSDPVSSAESPPEEWDSLFTELASVEAEMKRLTQDYKDVAGSIKFPNSTG